MTHDSISRLQHLCDTIPPILRGIDEQSFSIKPLPEKWSKKEILGHLIDSATNNQQRFVRGQFEDIPLIVYDQVQWVEKSYYQQMDSAQIISFWESYNRQLVALLKLIPDENMLLTVDRAEDEPKTLQYILEDYVSHIEHHLRQIIRF